MDKTHCYQLPRIVTVKGKGESIEPAPGFTRDSGNAIDFPPSATILNFPVDVPKLPSSPSGRHGNRVGRERERPRSPSGYPHCQRIHSLAMIKFDYVFAALPFLHSNIATATMRGIKPSKRSNSDRKVKFTPYSPVGLSDWIPKLNFM